LTTAIKNLDGWSMLRGFPYHWNFKI